MKRRNRLNLIKHWRWFRDVCLKITDETELKNFIINQADVTMVEIRHGWTTYETVICSGIEYTETEFWAINGLKKIANRIYKNKTSK